MNEFLVDTANIARCITFYFINKTLFIFNLVLTHCQVNEIAAVLYILVTESFLFDVMAVKAFAPILKEESFQDIKKVLLKIQDQFSANV